MLKLLGKKALQSYVIVMLIFSVIMSIFIILILVAVYGEEHEDCKLVDFEIVNMCNKGSATEFTIKNDAEKRLFLKINGKKSEEYFLTTKTDKIFNILSEDGSIEVLPYIDYASKTYDCSGKVQKINTGVLTKC